MCIIVICYIPEDTMKNSQAFLAVAVFLLVHSNVDALTRPSSIRLDNNSYTGVVVAINNQIAESDVLIQRIKVILEITPSKAIGLFR